MDPDTEKMLRQLLRKSHQLPEPNWNLLARTTTRFSRAGQVLQGIDIERSKKIKPLYQDDKTQKRDKK